MRKISWIPKEQVLYGIAEEKKIDKLAENGELELKDIDCDKKSEENKDKLRTTKPRKYKGENF